MSSAPCKGLKYSNTPLFSRKIILREVTLAHWALCWFLGQISSLNQKSSDKSCVHDSLVCVIHAVWQFLPLYSTADSHRSRLRHYQNYISGWIRRSENTLLNCLPPLKRSRLIVPPTAASALLPLTSSVRQDWSHSVCQHLSCNLKCISFFRWYISLPTQPSNAVTYWWWKKF